MAEAGPDIQPVGSECPWCGDHWGGGEVLDGELIHCESCGRPITWLGYDKMTRIEREPVDKRTGRQRTRARWSKRGRRG